jgi:SNF2 family DNA or RNA helicase
LNCKERCVDEDDVSNINNPHLSRLLKQLRPFQREAYGYATKGIVNSRQFHVPKTLDGKKNKKKNKRDRINESNPGTHIQNNKPEKAMNLNGRLLLADEMGLGKSITSLAIMCHYMAEWPLLILCPASLRHIWPNEIEKFLPGLPPSSVYVVQGFDDADFYENERKRRNIKIVVATYSLLQKRSASARCLQDFQFQCVIADESHNLKQKDSQRTQLALPLLQGAKRLALLSGTVR